VTSYKEGGSSSQVMGLNTSTIPRSDFGIFKRWFPFSAHQNSTYLFKNIYIVGKAIWSVDPKL